MKRIPYIQRIHHREALPMASKLSQLEGVAVVEAWWQVVLPGSAGLASADWVVGKCVLSGLSFLCRGRKTTPLARPAENSGRPPRCHTWACDHQERNSL